MALSKLLPFPRKKEENFDPVPPGFVKQGELDRGAYGVVYRGELDGKKVAIKEIHETLLKEKDSDGLLRAFQNECHCLKSLNHPNVVKFMGAFRDKKKRRKLILVMEQMKENLEKFLKNQRGKLSFHWQLVICYQIADGLVYLHSRQPPVFHRDLSDRNILIAEDGTVKISDFGQSKLIDDLGQFSRTTQPGAVVYMPPEALKSGSHYTLSVDIFSLGVLMLEITTQQPPQVGLTEIGSKPEVLRRAADLELLGDNHLLKPLIIWCFQKLDRRPTAAIILQQISVLTMQRDLEGKDSRIRQLQTQLLEEVKANEENLAYRQMVSEYSGIIVRLEEELTSCKRRNTDLKKTLDSAEEEIEARKRNEAKITRTSAEEIGQLEKRIEALQREKESEVQRLQREEESEVQRLQEIIQKLQQENQPPIIKRFTLHKTQSQVEQTEKYQAIISEVRKDREEAADKFAEKEKEWMEKIRRAEEERDHFQTLVSKHHSKEMKTFRDICKKLSAEKERLENRLTTNEKALQSATRRYKRLKKANQSLRATEQQRSSQTIQDLQDQCQALQVQVCEYHGEIARLEGELTSAKNRITGLEKSFGSAVEEIEARKQKEAEILRNSAEEKGQLEKRIETLQDQCQALQVQESRYLGEEARLEEELTRAKTAITDLEKYLESVEEEIEDRKQNEAEILRNSAEEKGQLEKRIETLQDQCQALQAQIEQYCVDCIAERKDREEAASKFAAREEVVMKQIRKAEEEKDHFQELVRKHLAEKMAIQNTHEQLSAEREHLEYQLATKEKALHTETQHNVRLKRENQTLRAEVKDTRQCYLQTTQELQHSQEQMEKQKMEINRLELSNRRKDENVISHLLRKKKELECKYETAVKNERITSQHNQEVEQENHTLKTQVEDTRQALQEEQQMLATKGGKWLKEKERLKKEIKELEGKIEQYRVDCITERKDREEAASKFADRENILMKQIRRAEKEKGHFEALARKYRVEEMAIKDTYKQLCTEKEHLKCQLATLGGALHTECQHNERLRQENETLRAELEDSRHCSLQTTQELQHSQEQMEKQKMEINRLELELSNRRKEENVISRLLREKKELECKYETAVKNEQTLKTQVEDTRQALQEKEQMLATKHCKWLKEKEEMKKEIKELEGKVSEYSGDKAKLEEELNHARRRITGVERTLDSAKEEIEASKRNEAKIARTSAEEKNQLEKNIETLQDQWQALQAQNKKLQSDLEYKNTWSGWVGSLFGSSNK